MEQRIRIELIVDTNPPLNLDSFKERLIDANKNVLKEISHETGVKIDDKTATLVVSNKNYDKWHGTGDAPTFYADM